MDSLVRALIYENQAQIIVASTRQIVNRAIEIHDLSPTPAAALGRMLTAGIMMAQELKSAGGGLTITMKGDGALGSIVVSSDTESVRGYVDHPHAEAPPKPNGKLDVCGVVGNSGHITVVRSDGNNPPYVGVSEIVSGEIAEDITYYYASSEQKKTAVSLGVLLTGEDRCISAGGVLVHLLPFASEACVSLIESKLSALSDISKRLKTQSPEKLLAEIFGSDCKIVEKKGIDYRCKCSRKSIESVIASLGKYEAEKIIAEQGKIECCCHFCNQKYRFYQADLGAFFKE